MNKLVEIMIRWMTFKHAFHTDISKMYNVIKLDVAHWIYQLYLWSNSLKEGDEPFWKVIKTAIYGVVSSGNIAECGLRMTAELSRDEYPEAYKVIMYHIYVDDCISGTNALHLTMELINALRAVLALGGFELKYVVISGDKLGQRFLVSLTQR